jgi:hypothetical protein
VKYIPDLGMTFFKGYVKMIMTTFLLMYVTFYFSSAHETFLVTLGDRDAVLISDT